MSVRKANVDGVITPTAKGFLLGDAFFEPPAARQRRGAHRQGGGVAGSRRSHADRQNMEAEGVSVGVIVCPGDNMLPVQTSRHQE